MKTDSEAASELIGSDLKEVGHAVKKLANHAIKLGGLGFGTSFLKWVASFAAMYSELLTGFGPDKLENQHTYIPLNPLHFPQSSFMVIQPAQGTGWSMDCFCHRRFTPFLPQAFSRLVGIARIIDPSPCGGARLFCQHNKGRHRGNVYLPGHRMLPAARTHPSIRWVQKFLY
ncbi:hypothetical protein DH2020_006738 [Rehmannia glutinosa]|uniref:Uncharacterized protein n=1 Tax=Rehmannia glutinosa TaxID=99300 RepID=A0ABR0XJQ6_REHGL